MMATSEPGIFVVIRGQYKITISETNAIIYAQWFIVLILDPKACHIDMKPEGILSIDKPRKSFTCVVNITTAIPLVKPVVIG